MEGERSSLSSSSSSPSSSFVRVNLSRKWSPPNSATTTTSAGSTASTTKKNNPLLSSSDSGGGGGGGVVVVGLVGSRPATDATHLINTIIDANIFGSGFAASAAATDLLKPQNQDRCSRRLRLSYYYSDKATHASSPSNDGDGNSTSKGGKDQDREKEKQKGILFLLLSPPASPSPSPSDSLAEHFEADHLRGLLFIFSVCHVVLFLHESLRFDTEILKKFRVLQSAKHALSPFIRSMSLPKSSSSSSFIASQAKASSESPLGRRTGHQSSSSISLMSGSGSRSCGLPGHCLPVILFIFADDLSDWMNPSPATDDLAESSWLNQQPSSTFSSNIGSHRSSSTTKAPAPVVMLARPAGKMEGSLKKKLLTSLDAQIRFLIKKCRILGTEPGLRGIGNANALPLFSLDASRIVVLLDKSANQRGQSLDFITGLIDDSKRDEDMFLFGTQPQDPNHEEIQMIRDFIFRQSDTLRGRGGLPGNANCSSVAGVGIVAAAAAAAAASAAAGKPISAPELPSLEDWLSFSTSIIEALFSSEQGFINESGNIKSPPLQSRVAETQNEQTSRVERNSAESAIYCLENSMSLNTKFSISWCERAFPAAKEIYLKDLPACYPSSVHNAQLEKALNALRSMVKGSAVQSFTKKLEGESTHIWTSGRQLCDAVSLTGKPCMHQKHTDSSHDSSFRCSKSEHSSGYFFLHACACGRSRHLREDPFDFYSANINFNCSADCEDVLPTVVLPKGSNPSPVPSTSWRLLRLGGARYYKPSKGLLQVGFCSGENLLLKWTISFDKQRDVHDFSTGDGSVVSSKPEPEAPTIEEKKKLDIGKLSKRLQGGSPENQRKSAERLSSNGTNISFGHGLPSFTTKKPFSEVVAGPALVDSTFSNLKHTKQKMITLAKGGKQIGAIDQTDDSQRSKRTEIIKVQEIVESTTTNGKTNCNPFLQIGSNLVPVNTCDNGKLVPDSSRKPVIVYVGFEHECSYGHRFLLSPKHLMEFESAYSTEVFDRKHAETSNVLSEEVLPSPLKMTSSETATNFQHRNRYKSFTREETSKFQRVPGHPISSVTMEELGGNISHDAHDDGDDALSLLNRNLPIYMICPHCKSSTMQNVQDIKFASTVSQLQRIFLVTPPLPTVLATSPVIQFDEKCLPPSTPVLKQKLCFTLGSRVILPPESFLVLRLPFAYGVEKDDGNLQPLSHLKHQPELSAWLLKHTALQIVSMERDTDEKFPLQ